MVAGGPRAVRPSVGDRGFSGISLGTYSALPMQPYAGSAARAASTLRFRDRVFGRDCGAWGCTGHAQCSCLFGPGERVDAYAASASGDPHSVGVMFRMIVSSDRFRTWTSSCVRPRSRRSSNS